MEPYSALCLLVAWIAPLENTITHTGKLGNHKVGTTLRYVIGMHVIIRLDILFTLEVRKKFDGRVPIIGQTNDYWVIDCTGYVLRLSLSEVMKGQYTRTVNGVRIIVEDQVRKIKHFHVFLPIPSPNYQFHT